MDVVFVFLDSGTQNLYQLRQWIQPLERLAQHYKVGVLYTSNFADEELWGTGLQAFRVEGQEGIADFLSSKRPKVLLYPNQNAKNFYALRYLAGVHVWVSHGESDKAYMFQNTLKRYDYYFAAGQAAADRVARNVKNYNPSRIKLIGRPQIKDVLATPADYPKPGGEVRSVLYAPTWEGVTRATRYCSIDTHGLELVERLVNLGYQVVYRPHPLSGSRDPKVAAADASIRALLKAHNQSKTSNVRHYADNSAFGWQLNELDLMITDVSAVAYDWLVTGKPLMITKPSDSKALVADAAIFTSLRPIATDSLQSLDEHIARASKLAAAKAGELQKLREYHYGKPTSDEDAAFVDAIEQALNNHREHIANKPFSEPGLFASRGSKLRFLRYVNFALRTAAKAMGVWVPTKVSVPGKSKSSVIFTHFSDPFNGVSMRAAAKELFECGVDSAAGPLTLATNQISTYLYFKLFFATKGLMAGKRINLRVIPTTTAGDCEVLLKAFSPDTVFYLKHHPMNLMMLRSNGTSHALFAPESDRLFEPGHSLVMYDEIHTRSKSVESIVGSILEVSRPRVVTISSSQPAGATIDLD
jgi:CDP-glycerol glycerophosphotransferase (TagB/SpsB family)